MSLWRNQGWSFITGQSGSSMQVERVPQSRWFFPLCALHSSIRTDCRSKRGRRQTVFFTDTTRARGRKLKKRFTGSIWAKHKKKFWKFWQTRSHAIILYGSVPADCIERVVSTKSEVIMNQKTSTPRPPPKLALKEAWWVQRDDYCQRGSGIGKQGADEDKFKIDLRFQGVTQKAVYQGEDRTRIIWRLAQFFHRCANTKSPRKSCTTWVMSSTSNYVKSLRRHNARHVLNIDHMELCIVHADIVYYPQNI